MKRNFLQISALLILTFGVITGFSIRKKIDLSHYIMDEEEYCYYVPNEHEVSNTNSNAFSYDLFLGKSYVGFREALGFKESRGDYFTINKYGYMGKYQFSKSTLKCSVTILSLKRISL